MAVLDVSLLPDFFFDDDTRILLDRCAGVANCPSKFSGSVASQGFLLFRPLPLFLAPLDPPGSEFKLFMIPNNLFSKKIETVCVSVAGLHLVWETKDK